MTRYPSTQPIVTPALDAFDCPTHGDTLMSLKSQLRTGLAALALTVTTAALTLTTPALAYQPVPDQADEQDLIYTLSYWDVAVKFKGAEFRPGQYGNSEDVAFEIQNLGDTVAYPNIKLKATCNYRYWQNWSYAG